MSRRSVRPRRLAGIDPLRSVATTVSGHSRDRSFRTTTFGGHSNRADHCDVSFSLQLGPKSLPFLPGAVLIDIFVSPLCLHFFCGIRWHHHYAHLVS